MPDVFLSYSREDQATARRFAEGFEREGLSVWWDATLNPGEAFDEVTEKALEEAKAVVVLWSKKSVASRWVRAEATQAHEKRTLVPVMIEACKRPIMFELTHTADLSQWDGDPQDKAWQALLSGVRRFAGKGDPDPKRTGTDSQKVGQPKRPAVRLGVGILAALLVAGVALWTLNRERSPAANPVDAATFASPAAVPAAATQVTLAVLPFVDVSSARDQEYFSDGLTEELLNQLAQVKALRVTGRTSSFSFKGKNEDLRVIAEKLGVANLLEGSVRKDGDKLRITAQLVSGKDGAQVWSRTYNRELSGVFALQEEISRDVTRALSITLDVGDLPRARGGTTNVEAYDKFLRAAEALRGGFGTGLPVVVPLLREAVALDPEFQMAWLELSSMLGPASGVFPGSPDARTEERDAINARIKALNLDGQLAANFEAQRAWEDRDWAGAVAAVPKLRNDSALAAWILQSVGRFNDSVPYLQRQVVADPLAPVLSYSLISALDAAGRHEEAQAEFERGKGLPGNAEDKESSELAHRWSAGSSDPVAEKALLRSLLQRKDGIVARVFPGLADKLDDPVAARAVIHLAFESQANQSWRNMLLISNAADRFGDRDLALAALRRAFIDMRSEWPPSLWPSNHSGRRADPRFKDILREMGLVDYFRASGNWGDFCRPTGPEDFECR